MSSIAERSATAKPTSNTPGMDLPDRTRSQANAVMVVLRPRRP
jgi:hypothetical protein